MRCEEYEMSVIWHYTREINRSNHVEKWQRVEMKLMHVRCETMHKMELMMIAIWWRLQCNQIHEFFFGIMCIDYHFYHIRENQKLSWLSFTFKSNKFAISWEKYRYPSAEEVVPYNRWVIVVHVITIYSPHFPLKLELMQWICLFYQLFDVL